jgi:hypothetical protein
MELNNCTILVLDVPIGMYMQKYISLLSIIQSQPIYTPSTRNQATGFSFKEPFIRPMTENYEKQTPYIVKEENGNFPLSQYRAYTKEWCGFYSGHY